MLRARLESCRGPGRQTDDQHGDGPDAGSCARRRFVHVKPPSKSSSRVLLIQKEHPQSACRSEEHTSELQSLMRISYAVFCLTKKTLIHSKITTHYYHTYT